MEKRAIRCYCEYQKLSPPLWYMFYFYSWPSHSLGQRLLHSWLGQVWCGISEKKLASCTMTWEKWIQSSPEIWKRRLNTWHRVCRTCGLYGHILGAKGHRRGIHSSTENMIWRSISSRALQCLIISPPVIISSISIYWRPVLCQVLI